MCNIYFNLLSFGNLILKAVINGDWLLLEDLDAATQDCYTILSNLLENDYLSVPGYRDYIRIAPTFQLFTTIRYVNAFHLI